MAEPLGVAYALKRLTDNKWYHPGGQNSRWRDTPSAFALKAVVTKARNADITYKNQWGHGWQDPVTEADYEIIKVALIPV